MLTVIFFLLCFGLGAAVAGMPVGERLWLALRQAGYAIDNAASDMDLSARRLYAFFRGESPLDVRRIEKLPAAVRDRFDALSVESRGGVVITDARLATLLVHVDEFVMAKAELRATAAPRRRSVQLPLGQKAKAS